MKKAMHSLSLVDSKNMGLATCSFKDHTNSRKHAQIFCTESKLPCHIHRITVKAIFEVDRDLLPSSLESIPSYIQIWQALLSPSPSSSLLLFNRACKIKIRFLDLKLATSCFLLSVKSVLNKFTFIK